MILNLIGHAYKENILSIYYNFFIAKDFLKKFHRCIFKKISFVISVIPTACNGLTVGAPSKLR
jgi:hypothetical protein